MIIKLGVDSLVNDLYLWLLSRILELYGNKAGMFHLLLLIYFSPCQLQGQIDWHAYV